MRCWVVGNGPSLANTPLDLLKGEISFGCNNIHLIYPKTSWRPSTYVRAEQAYGLEPSDWLESMQTNVDLGAEIWCNDYFLRPQYGLRLRDEQKVNLIKSCAHYQRHFDSPDCPHSLHLPVLCTYGSSVNVAVQIAMLHGYSPIYLLGCDLGYVDGKSSHFDENYEQGEQRRARYANMDTLQAHILAARTGWEIYNCTIGGNLEVFPRKDLHEVLAGRERPLSN